MAQGEERLKSRSCKRCALKRGEKESFKKNWSSYWGSSGRILALGRAHCIVTSRRAHPCSVRLRKERSGKIKKQTAEIIMCNSIWELSGYSESRGFLALGSPTNSMRHHWIIRMLLLITDIQYILYYAYIY